MKKKFPKNRREFFKRIIYALLSLQIIYFFVRILKPTDSKLGSSNLFEAGKIALFDKNSIYPFSSSNFYLFRTQEGGFLALSSKCTHLGCTIQFIANHEQFECPCHASIFKKNGDVITSPATRALDYYPVIIENETVYVDLNNPQRRDKYESSQATFV